MKPRRPLTRIIPILLCVILILFSIGSLGARDSFQLVGHKDCRSLMPENTFPGFIHADELGMTTIPMDEVMIIGM